MNSDTRKKLIRLIFPVLILLVMVVLIIMARARDARALQAALDAHTAKTESSSTETGETSASTGTETSVEESSDTYPTDGEAVTADQLEGAVTTLDGAVVVSFVSMDEETKMLTIRIDNNYTEDISTQGHPTTVCDGTDVLLNPLGPNQKLNYVTIPMGTYHLITYKVDARVFTCTSLEIGGTLRIISNSEAFDYDLTIK